MRYRYILKRDDAKNKLLIQEFARNADETLTLLGSRDVDGEKVKQALAQGAMAVVDVLRNLGMYPPESVSTEMAALAKRLYGAEKDEISEGHVDEIDVLSPEAAPAPAASEDEVEDDVDVDIADDEILDGEDLDVPADDDDMADLDDDDDPLD